MVPSDSNGIKGEENEKAKMDVDEETDIKYKYCSSIAYMFVRI